MGLHGQGWQNAAELRNDLQPLSHEEEDSLLSNETVIDWFRSWSF